MKKICKNALAVLLLVAVVLCFAGCDGGAGGNPVIGPDGRVLAGYVGIISHQNDISLSIVDNNTHEYLAIHVFWYSGSFDIAIIYDDSDENTVSAMTNAYIGGQVNIQYPDYSQSEDMDGWFGFENLTKAQLLSKIPSSGSITCCVHCDTQPDKNVCCTFPEDKADVIRTWIRNHE